MFYMRKLFKICMALLLVVGIIAAPTVYRGYELYRDAVGQVSVEEKAAAIMADENYVSLSDMDEYFVNEIIRSEDKRFRWHFGIDPLAIARAAKNDILAGSFIEGGSTITQQLAKNMYFDFDKVMERKVAEVFVAFRLERAFTKDQLLEMYLNSIYFGENCYGIKEAARHYYGTTPAELSSSQADSLVFTIKCPNLYNPVALAAG